MARKFKPHQASWGKIIPGLLHETDGRWRVVATGKRYTEKDEKKAVAKFLALTSDPGIDIPFGTFNTDEVPGLDKMTDDEIAHIALIASIGGPDDDISHTVSDGKLTYKRKMPSAEFWAVVRAFIISKPEFVAQMIGIPELARLADLPSMKPVKLTDVSDAYSARNRSRPITKTRAVKLFKEFAKVTGAKLLRDLTQDNIKLYRDHVEKAVAAPGYRKWTFGQIKSVLAFGLKNGIDDAQIRSALDKCRVLWVGDKMPRSKPCPMCPADYRRLLLIADYKWRAILLLGLNCCLHLGEVMALKWESFQGTCYSAVREKTGVPRGAVLWNETADAIAKLPRKGPYVFTSCHGTQFNRNGVTNDFLKLRKQSGVTGCTFEGIRDGAYTAASQTCDEKIVRVLAGHKAAGMLDAYVMRNAECTGPAVAAVHKVYGPFPPPN